MAALSFGDYARCDAHGLADLVRRGDASPTDLLDAATARLAVINPVLNAVVGDHIGLARDAIRFGLPEGPFRGVPFLLKDLFTALAGTVGDNGSRFHDPKPAMADATVVERYRAAGLVIFGKTHSPEFGGASTSESRRFGLTRNPFALTHSAGGSSGGAAAAIAAGVVPVAQASDAGGSIIIPASCCGLFGLKPSRGLVPLGPARVEGAGGLASQHVLSRSVRDSAAFLDLERDLDDPGPASAPAFSGNFLEAAMRDPGQLRIALLTRSIHGIDPDGACIEAALSAARLCQYLGHSVEEAALIVDAESLLRAETALRLASVAATVLDLARRIGRDATEADLEPATWQRYRTGLAISGVDILTARENMLSVAADIARFMRRYDLILSPAMAMPPPTLGMVGLDRTDAAMAAANRRCTTFAGLYNWTGQPSMSMPLSISADGLPLGVLFAGRYGEDALLFRLAGQLERAQGWSGIAPAFSP